MARMIPPKCDESVKSPGERELFQRLRDDPLTRHWVVLHQLEVASHRSSISGELDFLIIVPEMGVLALEVKAHREVKRDDSGRWYLGAGSTGNDTSPFTQVFESMHSLREYVQHRSTKFNSVPFFSAVIFTHCNFEKQSPEWRPWQSISSRRYRSRGIGRVIKEVLEKERGHYRTLASCRWFKDQSAPSKKQVEELLMVFRPPVEISQSPEEQLSLYENEVIRYTEEQFRALEMAEFNPRVLYTGPAGTGKTVLAIETARRGADSKRKVLWLCFNRPLADQVRKILKPLSDHVDVTNFHSFLMKLAPGAKVEDSQEFWDESLPLLATDSLLEGALEGLEYDQVIMDEAQDIVSHDLWLDVLDLAVIGGLSAGRLQLFGDFRGRPFFQMNRRAHSWRRSETVFLILLFARSPSTAATLMKLSNRARCWGSSESFTAWSCVKEKKNFSRVSFITGIAMNRRTSWCGKSRSCLMPATPRNRSLFFLREPAPLLPSLLVRRVSLR